MGLLEALLEASTQVFELADNPPIDVEVSPTDVCKGRMACLEQMTNPLLVFHHRTTYPRYSCGETASATIEFAHDEPVLIVAAD